MSKMNELYEKVSKDTALQGKLYDILNNTEELSETAKKEKLVLFAQEAGYDVTTEEIQVFFLALTDTSGNELADTELDMVAGGKRPSNLLISITSFGMGCAVMTLIDAFYSNTDGCKEK